MTAPAPDIVGPFLDHFTTLSLATTGPAGVWNAPVFFARDQALTLYFISSSKTRHARDLESNPQVAVTVYGNVENWAEISGVQLEGRAEVIGEDDRAAAEQIYLARFPAVKSILASPANDDERKIAAGFAASHFYKITPTFIRLIDNTKAFGYSEEFNLTS